MSTGEYDARIKQLSVVKKGTSFTVSTLTVAQDFDIIADIEVGQSLNAVISRIEIFASVGNRTQLVQAQAQKFTDNAPVAANAPREARITIPFNALAGVNEGDLLEATATLKITAGALTDLSAATSDEVIFVT